MFYIIPIGVCTAVEVAGSNLSLLTLSVGFHTIVKSSAPIFVLMYAVIFRLQRPNLLLLLSILCVIGGLVLAISDGDASGEQKEKIAIEGVMWVLAAVNAGGIRWSLCELMLKDRTFRRLPIALVVRTVPWCIVALPPFVLALEASDLYHFIESQQDMYIAEICGLAGMCGVVAFFLLFSEFMMIELTSALTLSIAAVLKELFVVTLSVIVGNDKLTMMNLAGFAVVILGVSVFKYERYRNKSHMAGDEQEDYDKVQTLEATLDHELDDAFDLEHLPANSSPNRVEVPDSPWGHEL